MLAVFLDPRFKDFAFIRDPCERETLLKRAIALVREWFEDPNASLPASQDLMEDPVEPVEPTAKEQRQRQKLHSLLGDQYGKHSAVELVPSSSRSENHGPNEIVEYVQLSTQKTLNSAGSLTEFSNPLCWWKEHCGSLPMLSRFARRVLCVMATSVACEQSFSTCGWLVNKRRLCLSEKSTTMLAFIACNNKLLEK